MSRRLSSATERAIERIKTGSTAYAAAKAEGIALSTIYRALKRLKQADALIQKSREI
jgi:Fe2+ or Zn2+ uptake regulation protein